MQRIAKKRPIIFVQNQEQEVKQNDFGLKREDRVKASLLCCHSGQSHAKLPLLVYQCEEAARGQGAWVTSAQKSHLDFTTPPPLPPPPHPPHTKRTGAHKSPMTAVMLRVEFSI